MIYKTAGRETENKRRKEGQREREPRTKADEKRSLLPLPVSPSFPFFLFLFFRSVERVSRADTKVHPCVIIFPSRASYRCRWQASSMFFSSLSSFIRFSSRTSTLSPPLSPWKPCGSYATFGPAARQAQRIPEQRRRVRRSWGRGRVREDTVQERDLDAIFKSGATSILSLLSGWLFLAVYASPPNLPSRPRKENRRLP